MAGFDISSQTVFAQQIQLQRPLESEGKDPNKISSNIKDEGDPNGSRDVVTRKRRGRPLGAKNKAKQSMIVMQESPNAIRAHLLDVQSGCDIFESLAAYTHKLQQGISILNAVGRVTGVTVRDQGVAGVGHLPLQGEFEIMSMSGTFLPPHIQTGPTTLALYLAGGQARVVGGNVVGPLIAYGPVIIIAAAFTFVTCERLPLELIEKQVETEIPFPGVGEVGGGRNYFLESTLGFPILGMRSSQ